MIDSYERAFKGVWIPAEVWLCRELSIMEKLFFVEISSLDREKGCFASNAHFSDFFGVGKARCTQIIKSLESKRLISILLIREGNNIVKRIIKCTQSSLENVPKNTPYTDKIKGKNSPKSSPLKVVKILNKVVNKLNNPIKYIKQPYLVNVQGSNTKIFNNTKESNTSNKVLSDSENSSALVVPQKPANKRTKKPRFIAEIFNLYPAHRRGGNDSQLWKVWQQEKLTAIDSIQVMNWLSAAAVSDHQWRVDANGQFVQGITKFIRERIWLTPVPVARLSAKPSLDMDDVSWAEDLNEGLL